MGDGAATISTQEDAVNDLLPTWLWVCRDQVDIATYA